MEDTFIRAQNYMKKAQGDVDNTTKLKFYGLYKQINDGPCTSKAPSKFKVTAYYKHLAHKALSDMSKETAMETFVKELTKIHPGWDNARPKL